MIAHSYYLMIKQNQTDVFFIYFYFYIYTHTHTHICSCINPIISVFLHFYTPELFRGLFYSVLHFQPILWSKQKKKLWPDHLFVFLPPHIYITPTGVLVRSFSRSVCIHTFGLDVIHKYSIDCAQGRETAYWASLNNHEDFHDLPYGSDVL